MMIRRHVKTELKTLLKEYPVVTILGPRQAGKTTLAKSLAGYAYSNLEVPEIREFAASDPIAYLRQLGDNVIIDEIQRVPQLLSYIQGIVDIENREGQYVLTGSYQLKLREAVTQSLAGRTAILHLFPFSMAELSGHGIEFDGFEQYCFNGFLPRIYDKKLRPSRAWSNYYQTYVERDVRQLIHLKDVSLFEKFMKLLAGRTGQLMNFQSLAGDVGTDAKTIKSWLSILEASFVVFKLCPYFNNFGKRVVKAPKYYFTDVGLLCFLLGIRKPEHIGRDPLVGNIFENLVVLECLKSRFNAGELPDLYFFRDSNGNEVDVIFEAGRTLIAIEIKTAATFSSTQLRGLRHFQTVAPNVASSYMVYSGAPRRLSDNIDILHFKSVQKIFD